MEKTYELNGHKLLVIFEDRLIRIKEPDALQLFLSSNIDLHSQLLVDHIKLDYLNLIGKTLQIKDESIIIEIWGHLYASYVAKALKNLVSLSLVDDFTDFIIKRSDIIDCGEKEVDSNRQFWDLLANFKRIILGFLPKKMKAKK